MLRLMTCGVAVAAILAPAAAHACMPPSVAFAYASTRLSGEGRAEVNHVAQMFRAQRGATVRLVAQTDGSKANLEMSRRRANVVKTALMRRGVPARNFQIETRMGSDAIILGEGYARLIVIELTSPPSC